MPIGVYTRTAEHKAKIAATLKGHVVTESTRQKISENNAKPSLGKFGESAPNWRGDKAGYDALHRWVQTVLGKPNCCSNCGTTSKRMYHWANLSGLYSRNIKDWVRLCVPCHKLYDLGKLELS